MLGFNWYPHHFQCLACEKSTDANGTLPDKCLQFYFLLLLTTKTGLIGYIRRLRTSQHDTGIELTKGDAFLEWRLSLSLNWYVWAVVGWKMGRWPCIGYLLNKGDNSREKNIIAHRNIYRPLLTYLLTLRKLFGVCCWVAEGTY